MKTIGALVSVGMAVLLQGCTTPISEEKLRTADYGTQPSANYKELVATRVSPMFIDPMSAVFQLSEPRKGYTKRSPIMGTEENFGWQVCGTVNAKNRFGGYVGAVPLFVLFHDDKIVEVILGEQAPKAPNVSMTNIAIEAACNR
jgi:hypothetical protein